MLYEFELSAAMTDGDDDEMEDDDEIEKDADEEEEDGLDGGPEIGTVVEEEDEPEF